MSHYNCVVVGAGVEGSGTALALARRGVKTLLLEKFPLPHTRGSSHGASRIIRRAYPADTPVYTEMMMDAYDSWARIEQQSGQKLFTKAGLLWVGMRNKGEIRACFEMMKNKNLSADYLDHVEIKNRYPQLSYDQDFEAVYDHDAGILHADKCLQAIQKIFIANGGTLKDGTTCHSLHVSPNRISVRTSNGLFTADRIVLCLGPWAGPFIKDQLQLDLPLEVQILKPCYWANPTDSHSFERGFPTLITESKNGDHLYGLPSKEYPGLFKFAMHVGYKGDPDKRDHLAPEKAQIQLDQCINHVKQHFLEVEAQPSIVETCIYTVTPSGNPFMAVHPHFANVAIGAGFSGHGFKFAPIAGEILADLVTGRECKYDLGIFSIPKTSVMPKNKL